MAYLRPLGRSDYPQEAGIIMHSYVFYAGETPPPEAQDGQLFQVGENLKTGEGDFCKHFGDPSSLERDLLVLASTVFATDLLDKRKMREEITRDIRLSVPVVNYFAFENQRVALERILHFLSHDNWTLTFRPRNGTQESYQTPPPQAGKTLLFSGGLDSLAAAVKLLDEFGTTGIQLASHSAHNSFTLRAQKLLHDHLEERYQGQIERVVIYIGGKSTEELEFSGDREVTQRTRSFAFLTIAALAARRRGMSQIVMIAENGQMAIHLPLSGGRIGAFSTHTAHPKFVKDAAAFFSTVLQYPILISNPFIYQTKAEVVKTLASQHQQAISLSSSCWKTRIVAGGHCGECIPCLIRRIALESHGVEVDVWKRDIFAENVGALNATDEGKRNLSELALFASDFRNLPNAELDINYCELFSPDFDHDSVVAMYRRFGEEAQQVLSRYASLQHLL
jgi:7-cyano-7-deazaguanine synthase in queuosine biosynthesis